MANLIIKLFDYIYVSFQKRNTESGSPLGALAPWGEDSVSRKKMAQIDAWGDPKFNAVKLENIPVSGFRVSDFARHNGWNGDNTVIQIEDPRGFELQISVDNMIQIMNGNTIVDGEIKIPCVWGRDGSRNILLPINSEPYKNAIDNTERLKQTFNIRGVRHGNKLELKDGRIGIYYGAYYQILRKQINEDQRSLGGFDNSRQYEKVVVDPQKLHLIHIIENKAVADFKPHLEVTKSMRVARQIDSGTISAIDAEKYINDNLLDRDTYRSCIGYTTTPELEFKIALEPTNPDVLRNQQGLNNTWSTGKTIFIAKNADDYMLCDGSMLIDMSRSHRYIQGMGYVNNDTRVYGRTIDINQFMTGEFDILHRYKNSNLATDNRVQGYEEADLEYFQPYVIYTSKNTGIEYKMPY
jgi:hypothetical protein